MEILLCLLLKAPGGSKYRTYLGRPDCWRPLLLLQREQLLQAFHFGTQNTKVCPQHSNKLSHLCNPHFQELSCPSSNICVIIPLQEMETNIKSSFSFNSSFLFWQHDGFLSKFVILCHKRKRARLFVLILSSYCRTPCMRI